MEPGLALFVGLVSFLAFGLFWFNVVQPVMRDFAPEMKVSSVSTVDHTMSSKENEADVQTDGRQTSLSEAHVLLEALQLDRSRLVIIDTLVYTGWDVSEIRNQLKGDHNVIGQEIAAAKRRLGIEEGRTLTVRDHGKERVISY